MKPTQKQMDACLLRMRDEIDAGTFMAVRSEVIEVDKQTSALRDALREIANTGDLYRAKTIARQALAIGGGE